MKFSIEKRKIIIKNAVELERLKVLRLHIFQEGWEEFLDEWFFGEDSCYFMGVFHINLAFIRIVLENHKKE